MYYNLQLHSVVMLVEILCKSKVKHQHGVSEGHLKGIAGSKLKNGNFSLLLYPLSRPLGL